MRVCTKLSVLVCLLAPLITSLGADEAPAPKPLSSDKIKNGIILDVSRVFLASDGLLEIQWSYRNPGTKETNLFDRDAAANFMKDIYLIDPKEKTKYHVAEFTQKDAAAKKPDFQASEVVYTSLQPGESISYWAKFSAPPAASKEISFYVPNAPPQEDLPIGPTPPPIVAPADDKPLASQHASAGLQLQVTRVRRTSDGFVEVRWEFANPKPKDALLFDVDNAKNFPSKLFVEDPATKIWYPVAADDKDVPLMSPVKYTVVDRNGSETMWAKFKVPDGVKRVSLYLPHELPIEDLPVTEKK